MMTEKEVKLKYDKDHPEMKKKQDGCLGNGRRDSGGRS